MTDVNVPGSSPAKTSYLYNRYPLLLSVDILENSSYVHFIPFLCDMGCKKNPVFDMKDRVFVYFIIIIIIGLYIAINELKQDVKPYWAAS